MQRGVFQHIANHALELQIFSQCLDELRLAGRSESTESKPLSNEHGLVPQRPEGPILRYFNAFPDSRIVRSAAKVSFLDSGRSAGLAPTAGVGQHRPVGGLQLQAKSELKEFGFRHDGTG
jgi:hypothetical protein